MAKNNIIEVVSVLEDHTIYEQRAMDLAHIMMYDKETYKDVNIETILKAAEIAGLIRE